MKYLKLFESVSAYKFANNLEAMATNRLLTKDERENLENKIYNKIGIAAMGIYDKLMSKLKKEKRTEITEQDYEEALQLLADRLKRDLKPAGFIPNDEPDPNITYTYTNEEPSEFNLPDDDDDD